MTVEKNPEFSSVSHYLYLLRMLLHPGFWHKRNASQRNATVRAGGCICLPQPDSPLPPKHVLPVSVSTVTHTYNHTSMYVTC